MTPALAIVNMQSNSREDSARWAQARRQRRALVVVDVVESVRLMQAHEDDVIDRWRRFVNEVRADVLPARRGQMVKSLGDGMLLEFDQVPEALKAAFDLHRCIQPYNAGHGADSAIRLRVGAHVAEIFIEDFDVLGKGVNLASRLATLADCGETVVSADFRDELVPGVDAELTDMGECYLKHIAEPVFAFRAAPLVTAADGLRLDPVPQVRAMVADEPPADRPVVAVLPFDGDAQGEEASVLGNVIADGLIARLSVSKQLRVVSRLSSTMLKARMAQANDAHALVGAHYVVSGRAWRHGDAVLLMIELADARKNEVIWTERWSTALADLLAFDDEMSAALSGGIVKAINERELRRCLTRPLPTLAGHALQFSATHLMHRTSRSEFERAYEALEHLIDRHPRVPGPRAWAAKWHVLRVTRGIVEESAKEAGRALDHVHRALHIDPDCAMAMAMEGFVQCHILKDLDAAERQLSRAVEANPSESWAWLFRSVVASHRGQSDLAWEWVQHAAALSPLDPLRHYYDALMTSAAVGAGRFDAAIALGQRSLAVNRGHLPTLRALTIAQVSTGDIAGARQSAERILALDPDFTVSRYLAHAPPGGETVRRGYAKALRESGIPP